MQTLKRRVTEHATVNLSTYVMQEVEALFDRALIVRDSQLADGAASPT